MIKMIMMLMFVFMVVQGGSLERLQWSKFKGDAKILIKTRTKQSRERRNLGAVVEEFESLAFSFRTSSSSREDCRSQFEIECKELNDKTDDLLNIDFCDPKIGKPAFIRGTNNLCIHNFTGFKTHSELEALVDVAQKNSFIKEVLPEVHGAGSGDNNSFINLDSVKVGANDCVVQTDASWGQAKINNFDSTISSTGPDQDDHTMHANNFAGVGTRIYILDSGFDPVWKTQPEFIGRVEDGWTHFADANGDYNTVEEFSSLSHGTFIAGVSAGKKYGLAKSATIIPIKVIQPDGNGGHLPVSIHSASQWITEFDAIQADCDLHPDSRCVINMSLGWPLDCANDTPSTCNFVNMNGYNPNVPDLYPPLLLAVQNLVDNGIMVVGAAGNAGIDNTYYWPAADPNVITVGSVKLLANGQLEHIHNYGKIDIFAPGDDVLSTTVNGALEVGSGTSYATPFVVGAIATMFTEVDFSSVAVNNYHTFIMNKFENDPNWGVWNKITLQNSNSNMPNLFLQHKNSCSWTDGAGTSFCVDGNKQMHWINGWTNVSTKARCKAKCLATSDCAGITYMANKTCHFFGGVSVRGTNSYTNGDTAPETCDLVNKPFISVGLGECIDSNNNINLVAGLGGYDVKDENICKAACINNKECRAYRFEVVSFEVGNCTLYGDTVTADGSDDIACKVINRYNAVAREICLDTSGSYYLNSGTYEVCAQSCTLNDNCVGFQYSHEGNPVCKYFTTIETENSNIYTNGDDDFVCYKKNNFEGFLAKWELQESLLDYESLL